jgi:hypothetical protein
MTDDQQSPDQAVAALLAERARYEEWLHALEQKREQTPEHIYTRVHADYSARLQRVFEQLGSYRAAVEEMVATLLDRLTMLDIDEAKFRDERSEAELRGMIGELAEDQCTEVIRRCDEGMAALLEDKGKVSAELARLRAILEGSPATAVAVPRAARHSGPLDEPILLDEEPTAAPAPTPPAESSRRPPKAPQRTTAEWMRPSQGNAFDELEFLKAMVDTELGESTKGDESAATDPPPGQESGDEPALEAPPVHGAEPEREGGQQPAADRSAGSGRELRESVPSFLRTTPTEQVKTLKCQECGTMNYPTEWYCERCGAELAAL